MSNPEFARMLAAHGLVHPAAVTDPEGFDAGYTRRCIDGAAQELREWLAAEAHGAQFQVSSLKFQAGQQPAPCILET